MADLSRRKLLGSATATFLAGLRVPQAQAAPASKSVKIGPPPDILPDQGLNRLGDIFASNQVTILGDSDHRRAMETYSALSDPAVLKHMQAANVKAIALEVPSDVQHTVDALSAGKINRTQFATEMEMDGYVPMYQSPALYYDQLGKIVQSATRYGIKIVCADNLTTPEQLKLDKFVEKHGTEPDISSDNIMTSLQKKYPQSMASLTRGIVSSRDSDRFNLMIDKSLLPQLADGSHIIIMFGAEHALPLKRGFDKLGITSALVAMHPDEKAIQDARAAYLHDGKYSIPYDKMDNFNLETSSFTNDLKRDSASAQPSPQTPKPSIRP